MRRLALHGFFLARAQLGAQLQDHIVIGKAVQGLELEQQIGGHGAGAGAGPEDAPASKLCQHLVALARQAPGEERAELRGGGEVTPIAENPPRRAVITQARRVERKLHEAGEGDGSARGLDLRGDEPRESLGTRAFLGAGGGRRAGRVRPPFGRGGRERGREWHGYWPSKARAVLWAVQ